MVIESAVTPFADAVLASPSPHGESRSPNVTPDAAAVVAVPPPDGAVVVSDDPLSSSSRSEPQAATSRPMAAMTASHRTRRLRMEIPLILSVARRVFDLGTAVGVVGGH